MATSVNTSLPQWLAGCTYDGNGGNDLRNSSVTAMFYDVGIVTGAGGLGSAIGVLGGVIGGAGLWVSPGTGMTVSVQPGSFVVPNSASPTAGGYVSTLVSTATLSVQTADPTNPRIDIIVAYVSDAGSSASFGAVAIITGTAAPSPAAPSAPANSITVAQLSVPANTSSITSGLITDKRPFTTATGGVLIAAKGSVAGYDGQIAYDKSSRSIYNNTNFTGSKQIRTLPWQPVIATSSSPFNWNGSETTVLQTTVTTDGYTDLEIFFKWPGVNCSIGAQYSFNVQFRMYIDSSFVDGFFTPQDTCDGHTHSGGSWSYYTSSATGDTPSSGTHTIKVTCQNQIGNNATQVYAFNPNNKIILRVKPASM